MSQAAVFALPNYLMQPNAVVFPAQGGPVLHGLGLRPRLRKTNTEDRELSEVNESVVTD